MMQQLTVLACMDTGRVSGPARQLLTFAAAAPALGIRVRFGVFYRRPGNTPFLDVVRSQGHELRLVRSRSPLDAGALVALARVAREDDVDVLQTHGYKANVLAFIAARRIRRPWVAFLHGVTTETRRVGLYYRLEALAVRHADRVVVMSQSMREAYVRAGIDGDRVRIVHNAMLDRALPQPSPDTRDDLAIGIVARLSPEKGVDVGLRAFARLAARHPGLRLHIAGEGPERAQLQRLATTLGVDARVVWHGHVNEIDAIYRRLAVLVIPSRSEGLPNVALEAMASGVPVVATAVGGLNELIVPGQTGCLVAPEAPDALADAVGRLLESQPERERVANAARDDVRRRFSSEARVRQLRGMYDELLPRETGAAVAVQS
jgi:glycosyltransferase involved in cell wall biosynthesis